MMLRTAEAQVCHREVALADMPYAVASRLCGGVYLLIIVVFLYALFHMNLV
jgi:hypothetical protein